MTTYITLGAGILKVESHKIQMYWNPNDPYGEEGEVTTINDEKEVTNYYLTDTEGNEIEEYDIDDVITLNIETKNRIGDIITINLNDKEFDFEHNGVVLANDTLRDIQIGNDLEQIELKVVPENA